MGWVCQRLAGVERMLGMVVKALGSANAGAVNGTVAAATKSTAATATSSGYSLSTTRIHSSFISKAETRRRTDEHV